MASFWKNFDEDNIPKVSQELQDLIEVAQFDNKERSSFVSSIQKELSKKHICLDCLG